MNKYSKLNWNAFRHYKNKHNNDIAVVCGTGKTLLDYKPIDRALHIGCNGVIYYNKLNFDYYFFNDFAWSSSKLKQDVINYKPNIEKFVGTFLKDKNFGCPQEFAIQANAAWYDCEGPFAGPNGKFEKDIDKYILGDAGVSTIFMCMQFVLFCGFKEINIVGCDIIGSKYFMNYNNGSNIEHLLKSWNRFKTFIAQNQFSSIINVINPIGLKGYFNDKYQN